MLQLGFIGLSIKFPNLIKPDKLDGNAPIQKSIKSTIKNLFLLSFILTFFLLLENLKEKIYTKLSIILRIIVVFDIADNKAKKNKPEDKTITL